MNTKSSHKGNGDCKLQNFHPTIRSKTQIPVRYLKVWACSFSYMIPGSTPRELGW